MLIATYRCINRYTGQTAFIGTDEEIRKEFNLKSHIHTYISKKRFIKGKYWIVHEGFTEGKKTEYEQLLEEQMNLLKRYDSVVGYRKNIEKNIADLAKHGFKVHKRQATMIFGRGRKSRYWILEKSYGQIDDTEMVEKR